MQLEGKVAIVTGAAMGIGKRFAIALAREGARVVIADWALEQATQTQREIEAAGGQALALKVDVSKSADVNAAVAETVKRYGKIDILFNVAGVIERQPVAEMDEANWHKTINVNLTGTFL